MDSAVENYIVIHVGDGNDLKFLKCGRRLYYFDTKVKSSVTGYSFLLSVVSNTLYYTRREVQGADDAPLLQGCIGWPSDADYKQYIMKNCLKHCSTTVDHITNGKAIYGPLVPVLQWKMVRRRPQYESEVECMPIPSPVLSNHPSDSFRVDFFFIEQRPYLFMKSSVYKSHGINACRGRGKVETSSAIKAFLNKFGVRGVSITTIYGDNEFEKMIEALRPIHVDIVGRGQYVGDIECCVRTVK